MYKLDENHKEIVEAFEKLGCLVIDNAKVERYEAGQLDLFVGLQNPYTPMGIWIWVEIKTDAGELTKGQKIMIIHCTEINLPVEVVRSVADVENVYYRWLAIMQAGGGKRCSECEKIIPMDDTCCVECIPFR